MVRLRSVQAEIETPPVLEVAEGARAATLAVRVTLRNTGEDDVVVHAASGDARHFWHVFNSAHREVQREPGRGRGGARAVVSRGVHSFRSETIAAGHEEHASRELKLDATDGQVYTVRAEFFGHVAESSFAVVRVPRKARARPAAKKPARKRPTTRARKARMKAVKTRPAKKTAAKKKAAAPKKAIVKKPAKRKSARKTVARKPRPRSRKAG